MVAFYEKNGYRQTHIEPEKEGMDMVYMKKLIDNRKDGSVKFLNWTRPKHGAKKINFS